MLLVAPGRVFEAKGWRNSEDLDRLSFWTLVNGLPLNLKKCQKLVFHRCRNVVISDYTICNQLLESVNGKLDLGVVFDSKLNFSDHLNYIIPRAYSSLYFIRRNADEFADPYTKKILYCAYVRSKLEYCSFVWSPNALKHINRIESVQKKFVKFALKSLNFSHPMPSYVSRCALISLQSLRSRREIDSLVFLQGILTSLEGKLDHLVCSQTAQFGIVSHGNKSNSVTGHFSASIAIPWLFPVKNLLSIGKLLQFLEFQWL
ncbi:uncharacterized protein LOC142231249 [Haematobia irritans]|uniref:uncharacterized protein LOC142231249 n=1 Tax=Haematobia irritans TaxID=7368 RepID=UPI003F50A947